MTHPLTIWARCFLALLVVSAASCEDPRPALIRGRIAGLKSDQIIIAPLHQEASDRPLVLSMDERKTTILARHVASGTMNLEHADRADLIVGREVSVTTYGHRASVIRVFPPKPVRGRVTKFDGSTLTISLDDPGRPDNMAAVQFAMSGTTKILLKTVEATPLTLIGASELKAGRLVFVYAQSDDAVAVKIVPEPLVVGVVARFDSDRIVIRHPGAGGNGIEETAISYTPCSSRAVIQYLGTDATASVSLHDIKPGARAAVYAEEGGAIIIKFVSQPVRGHLLAVNSKSITFQADGLSTASQQYRIVASKTVVMVPRTIGTAMRAGGRSHRTVAFAPGTLHDLRRGQSVLLSAADDVAIAITVAPVLAAQLHDPTSVPEGALQ